MLNWADGWTAQEVCGAPLKHGSLNRHLVEKKGKEKKNMPMHLFMYYLPNPQMYSWDVEHHGRYSENKAQSWTGFVPGRL